MKNRNMGIVLSYANTVISMVCGLFLSTFLLQTLGKVEYGIYQTVAAFANYLVLLEFGTGTVMVRNISICLEKKSGKEEVNKNISTLWSITTFLSIVISVVACILFLLFDLIYAKSFSGEQIVYAKKIFVIITVYLILSFYGQTLKSLVLAFEDYTYKSKIALFTTGCRTALLILLVLFFKYAIVVAIVDMTISIVTTVYSYFYCKRKFKIELNFKNFDKLILKSSLPLCVAIFLQAIINQANNNVDKFLIGILLNPESVAVYSIPLYIFSIFSSFTTIPISIYAPQVVRDVSKGLRKRELADTLIQPCRIIVLIGGAILFGFISAGEQFITFFYGAEYKQTWIIAIILMVPMFINMSNGILINVLDAMNKRMSRSVFLCLTTILNIILTIYGINTWGIIGAAIATAVSTVLGQILLMNVYYKKVIEIPVVYLFYKIFRGILLWQIIASIVCLQVKSYLSNIYVSFVITGILYLTISFGGWMLFGANNNEKTYAKKMIQKVKGKINA